VQQPSHGGACFGLYLIAYIFILIISDFGEATHTRPMTPISKGSEASCHGTENNLAGSLGFANLDAFGQFLDLMAQSFG